MKPENVRFFAAPAELGAWLDEHEATATSLWVGFYKKGSGRSGVTYVEAVDEALCHGWIDGQSGSVDEVSYAIRFTPRRARSSWSATNIARTAELIEQGRVRPSGLRAFEARSS